MNSTTTTDVNRLLVEQVDWHWRTQLRPRLDGLTDDEYLWEPVAGMWSVHPRGHGRTELQGGSGDTTIDFAHPEPTPAPVTTIAWRMAHLVVGVLAMRVHGHFGGPPADYLGFEYSPTASGALAQLDEKYAAWIEGVHGWGEEGLREPCGPAEGPWADHPRADLVAHINRELIHHGAELALLRDLYAHRDTLSDRSTDSHSDFHSDSQEN